MYPVEFSKELERKLEKLQHRDKKRFEITLDKIREIKENPEHYKPLRHDLSGLRRVHVGGSFVLVFGIVENKIIFLDLDHHDIIYKKRFFYLD